jgi:hypothetical protein
VLDVVSCPTVYLGCAMGALLSTVSFKCLKCGSTNVLINWHVESASAIPREFMTNAKIMELLSCGAASSISSTASSIISSAVTHQETASESRIGLQVHRGSTLARSEPAGLKRFKNIQKSSGSSTVSIRAERKDKKGDWIEQQAISGPKFSVTLWKCHDIQEKPKQVVFTLSMHDLPVVHYC